MNLSPPIDLALLQVVLSVDDDGNVFPKNGNHRIGAIVERFGLDAIVSGEIERPEHTNSHGEWD